MSPSTVSMAGRRVPDGTSPADYEAGDYGKRGSTWWVCLPTGVLGRIDDRWSVTEHDDGAATIGDPLADAPLEQRKRGYALGHDRGCSITVTPSIWDSPQGWHGWLDHGAWRSA